MLVVVHLDVAALLAVSAPAVEEDFTAFALDAEPSAVVINGVEHAVGLRVVPNDDLHYV